MSPLRKQNNKYKQAAEEHSQRFGNLTAIGYREMPPITLWDCICVCGNRRVVEENRLFAGKVSMCIPCEFKIG